MKNLKTIYWIATGIVCSVMVFSVITFTFFDHALYPEGAFVHLGLPNYFKIELTVAKTLGVLALLLPGIPRKIKEFAYFGFAITLVSASIAHFSVGDAGRPPLYGFYIVDPLIFLGVLAVSYWCFNKIQLPRREMPAGNPATPKQGKRNAIGMLHATGHEL